MFQSLIRAKGNSDGSILGSMSARRDGFNPSFGLKAIPTKITSSYLVQGSPVSIPHSG